MHAPITHGHRPGDQGEHHHTMVLSALFADLVEIDAGAADVLAAAEIRRLAAGSSHRADSFRGASFLIVEEGFVVVRSATAGRRGIITCHAGAGALPGGT